MRCAPVFQEVNESVPINLDKRVIGNVFDE